MVVGVTLAILASSATTSPQKVNAGLNDRPLGGWAWSDNIGWIKFAEGSSPVIMNGSTGELSGYAWSDSIGWISFNAADVADCPSGSSCSPSVNLSTGAVTGWARACTATVSGGCSGTPPGTPMPVRLPVVPATLAMQPNHIINLQTGLIDVYPVIVNNTSLPVTLTNARINLRSPLRNTPTSTTLVAYYSGGDGISGGIPYANVPNQVIAPGQSVTVTPVLPYTSSSTSGYAYRNRYVNATTSSKVFNFYMPNPSVNNEVNFTADIDGTSVMDSGWDGWIELSGPNHTSPDFSGTTGGVTFATSTNVFKGFAWGSEVVGWIKFTADAACAPSCGVVIDPPVTTYYSCTGTAPTPNVGVSAGQNQSVSSTTPWTYIAPPTVVSACQWTCLTGHTRSGNTCVPDTVGTTTPPAGGVQCTIPTNSSLCTFSAATSSAAGPSFLRDVFQNPGAGQTACQSTVSVPLSCEYYCPIVTFRGETVQLRRLNGICALPSDSGER